MSPQQINRFFHVLGRELDRSARVILTGAAAGSLMGRVRPSLDVDFAITPQGRAPNRWERVEAAVERATRLTGIPVNYAADIDRWSSISLLDYARHTIPWRRYGKLRVRLLDPAYWSIGKLSRYLDPDVADVLAVLKRQRIPVDRLIRIWGRALRASSPSAAGAQFRRQVEHFLRTYGPTLWGRRSDAELAVERFRQAASRRARPRRHEGRVEPGRSA